MTNEDVFSNKTSTWESFDKNLRTLNTIHYNPFSQKGYFMQKMDLFNARSYFQKVNNIDMYYNKETLEIIILFESEDIIKAIYCSLLLTLDNWGYDPDFTVEFNDFKQGTPKSFNDYFNNFLENIDKNANCNVIKVQFSNTAFGINAFEYNLNCVVFEIDKNHTDSWFLDKEILRRQNLKKG